MFHAFWRWLLGGLACAMLIVLVSLQHSPVALAAPSTGIAVTQLSVKPLPEETKTSDRPVFQQAPEPLPEPLYWHGPVEPYALTPGVVPVVSRIPTSEPVVFLTIDDGWFQNPDAFNWLLDHKLPATMFLENDAVKNNYPYFQRLQSAGLSVEDHTLTHPDLTKLPIAAQQAEICGTADIYTNIFGQRPTLFRPPYGSLNDLTVSAAATCGMSAVVLWHATVSGGQVQFQAPETSLEPGDIVLMHFRPEFLQDITAFTNEIQKDHLQVARLEDWLP